MKKIAYLVTAFILTGSAAGQNFPPPAYFDGNISNDSVCLSWQPPESKALSGYHIYYCGYSFGLKLPAGTTTNTHFTVPIPPFPNLMSWGVSAYYSDPEGESDTLWCYFIIPGVVELPALFDFDEWPFEGELAATVLAGADNWERCDTAAYSQGHSAAFISAAANSVAWLIISTVNPASAAKSGSEFYVQNT